MSEHLIAIESFDSPLPAKAAESLDRYVPSGEGDPRRLLNRLAGWYLWDTEEMLDLVEWIGRFNEGREMSQKVHIFGIDITSPAPGVEEVLGFLDEAGVESGLEGRALGLDLQEGDFWPRTLERYAALSEERRAEFAENYEKLIDVLKERKAEWVASSSRREYVSDAPSRQGGPRADGRAPEKGARGGAPSGRSPGEEGDLFEAFRHEGNASRLDLFVAEPGDPGKEAEQFFGHA